MTRATESEPLLLPDYVQGGLKTKASSIACYFKLMEGTGDASGLVEHQHEQVPRMLAGRR